jgi:hypothetical protein
MEIKPTYWIKFFDNVSFDPKELLQNPTKVYVPPLQLRVTKRESKVSLHHLRYKLFLIPSLWHGVARVGPEPQFRKKTSELHAIIPFCHSKKITNWIRIQTHSIIRIEKGSNGEWHFMIFRLTLVSLAHFEEISSMATMKHVLNWICSQISLLYWRENGLILLG